MLYQKSKFVAFAARNRPRRRVLQFALALAIAMLVPLVAGAYTIVLRDGRQREIPATFIVTGTTLTYERAPGLNITLQLSIIDIAATERINREAPGSFLRRAESTASSSAGRTQHSRLNITNADLERARRARLESEKTYEQRRRELGLPSLEETRRREEQQARETLEVIRQSRYQEESSEAYWRSRAMELRAQIATVDAELNYLRGRLTEFSDFRFSTPGLITNVGPFVPFANIAAVAPARFPRAGVFVAPNAGAQVSGRFVFGAGRSRGQVLLNPRHQRLPFNRGRGFGMPVVAPFGSAFPFNSPVGIFPSYADSYERATIIEQLNNLSVTRAGLQARWRLLEDEARRAGAPPGWLRP